MDMKRGLDQGVKQSNGHWMKREKRRGREQVEKRNENRREEK
jgi:hypothetical protein